MVRLPSPTPSLFPSLVPSSDSPSTEPSPLRVWGAHYPASEEVAGWPLISNPNQLIKCRSKHPMGSRGGDVHWKSSAACYGPLHNASIIIIDLNIDQPPAPVDLGSIQWECVLSCLSNLYFLAAVLIKLIEFNLIQFNLTSEIWTSRNFERLGSLRGFLPSYNKVIRQVEDEIFSQEPFSSPTARGRAVIKKGPAGGCSESPPGRHLRGPQGPRPHRSNGWPSGLGAIISSPRTATPWRDRAGDFSSFEGVVGALEVGGSQLPSEPEMIVSCHLGTRDFLL